MAVIFYLYFNGHGREAIADTLGCIDPFALSAAEVVERVLALGNAPDLRKSRDEMWPTKGRVTEVERNGQAFLVALSWEAQEISVQEVRDYEFSLTD